MTQNKFFWQRYDSLQDATNAARDESKKNPGSIYAILDVVAADKSMRNYYVGECYELNMWNNPVAAFAKGERIFPK